MTEDKKNTYKTIAQNRRARHDYHIEDTFEAGLMLTGTEIKSLRAGKANITDTYVTAGGTEAWVENMQISPYEQGNRFNVPEKRRRKLLLHKREIGKLAAAVNAKGYTVVGLELYFKGALAKLRVGIAKGKQSFDKRQDIKDRDAEREMDRARKGDRH